MKTNILTLALLIVTFYSCKKESVIPLQEDNGCIERIIIPVTGHTINGADIPLINTLFTNNNIDNSKYRYYQYLHDSVQTNFPPYSKFDNKVIKVDEYTNGLRIFTGQLVFAFKNKIFSFEGGYPTNGTTLNTVTNLTLGQLRKLFIDNIEKFDHQGSQYKDNCFKAEFGYFNLNAGISNSTENLVKAWRVTLKNSFYPSEYPIAYYQDNDGELIYYDNGVRTLK